MGRVAAFIIEVRLLIPNVPNIWHNLFFTWLYSTLLAKIHLKAPIDSFFKALSACSIICQQRTEQDHDTLQKLHVPNLPCNAKCFTRMTSAGKNHKSSQLLHICFSLQSGHNLERFKTILLSPPESRILSQSHSPPWTFHLQNQKKLDAMPF